MLSDPFLNYFALGVLIFVIVVLFYGVIAIHDIPHHIAKLRNHPHQDAIHAAGWVSLFTLHALWPFLWIWAMAYKPDRGWGFGAVPSAQPIAAPEPIRPAAEPQLAEPAEPQLLAPPPEIAARAEATEAQEDLSEELDELRRRVAALEEKLLTRAA
jgi:hypothetical protein